MKSMNPATTHSCMSNLVRQYNNKAELVKQEKSALYKLNSLFSSMNNILKKSYSMYGHYGEYSKQYECYLTFFVGVGAENERDLLCDELMYILGLPADHTIYKRVDSTAAIGSFSFENLKFSINVYGPTNCKVTYVTKSYEEAVYSC